MVLVLYCKLINQLINKFMLTCMLKSDQHVRFNDNFETSFHLQATVCLIELITYEAFINYLIKLCKVFNRK